jgi:hypothetical protein
MPTQQTAPPPLPTLVEPNLYTLLVGDIVRQHGTSHDYANRIIQQALGFLRACALNPDAHLSPSPDVDKGWHAFMLRTRAYADFCEKVAGRFIHHAPDEPGTNTPALQSERIGATIAAMRAAGIPVDLELWKAPAECSQCYAGCADDPAPTVAGNGYGGFAK